MIAPFNLNSWINKNRHLLKPPVGNKLVFENAEFIIMVVGGPNIRKDYHIDEGEEFFYQLQGKMNLKIIVDGLPVDTIINEGDVFLLPPKVPHSPQRFKDTVGLVIERKRNKNELDGFQWYCDTCNNLLHEVFITLTDITIQLPVIFNEFWGNHEYRTCDLCSSILEDPNVKN